MQIVNLTQHLATPEQVAAGVVDLPNHVRDELVGLLTFEEIPTTTEMGSRATRIGELWLAEAGRLDPAGDQEIGAMIGGASWFMPTLVTTLEFSYEIAILFAFSRRVSTEETLPDGSVRKVSVFRHVGFVRCN